MVQILRIWGSSLEGLVSQGAYDKKDLGLSGQNQCFQPLLCRGTPGTLMILMGNLNVQNFYSISTEPWLKNTDLEDLKG